MKEIKKKKKKKEIKDTLIKDTMIRYIRTLSEQQEGKNYYKPKLRNNYWNNNYMQYESNDKNKNLSLN